MLVDAVDRSKTCSIDSDGIVGEDLTHLHHGASKIAHSAQKLQRRLEVSFVQPLLPFVRVRVAGAKPMNHISHSDLRLEGSQDPGAVQRPDGH